MEQIKEKILEFLSTQIHGVISTFGQTGFPESAAVGISGTEELELIFGTSNESRKYANLKKNPNTSFVIGWGDKTIQYEGVARELEGDEAPAAQDRHIAKIPSSAKYASLPTQRYFKVTPRWIRLTDFNTNPETIEEISF